MKYQMQIKPLININYCLMELIQIKLFFKKDLFKEIIMFTQKLIYI